MKFSEIVCKKVFLRPVICGLCAASVEKVLCDVYGKIHEKFLFFLDHFVAMAKYHGFITHDDGKHYHGCYDMLHYTIGCIATAQ